jgi:hypothetical protein
MMDHSGSEAELTRLPFSDVLEREEKKLFPEPEPEPKASFIVYIWRLQVYHVCINLLLQQPERNAKEFPVHVA